MPHLLFSLQEKKVQWAHAIQTSFIKITVWQSQAIVHFFKLFLFIDLMLNIQFRDIKRFLWAATNWRWKKFSIKSIFHVTPCQHILFKKTSLHKVFSLSTRWIIYRIWVEKYQRIWREKMVKRGEKESFTQSTFLSKVCRFTFYKHVEIFLHLDIRMKAK